MTLNIYLANRLKEVYTEGKWVIGTNFKAQIFNLDWKLATQKIDGFNTIADLTFHINYYLAGVKKAIIIGILDIQDKYSFNYPIIKSENDWQNLVREFCFNAEEFISLIEKMTEEELQTDFVDKKYGSYLRNIDLMIEHCYYHLGQIILIKKLIEKK